MKTTNWTLGLLLSLSSSVSVAGVTFTEDFVTFDNATNATLVDDYETGPFTGFTASMTRNGVTYTGSPNVGIAVAGYTNFGVPITTSNVVSANGHEDITLGFHSPVYAVGFDTYLNQYGPATVSVYGANGLLDSYSLSHAANVVGFLGIYSTEAITSLNWLTVNGGTINTGFDNLYTDGAVVDAPAPGSLALLLGGLLWPVARSLKKR